MLDEYAAACIQTDVHVVPDDATPAEVEAGIHKNLKRQFELVDYLFKDRRYGGPRVGVFSEFSLVGTPESRTYEAYINRLVEIPGWVTEEYGRKAREYGIYLVGNTYEGDPEWPGYVFNTAFMVGPDGDVLLRYRKNNSSQVGVARTVNTGDVYTEYIAKYGGPDALFPVVETELGTVALMVCVDGNYPEVARCLALRGAEIIFHPTAEAVGGPARDGWDMTKQVNCFQNALFMVSTNNGRTLGSLRPEFRQSGNSKIIDYMGRVIVQATAPGEAVVTANIDMEALRKYRAKGGGSLFTSRYETYIPIFEKYGMWPVDVFADEPNKSSERVAATRSALLERLHEEKRLNRPRSEAPVR